MFRVLCSFTLFVSLGAVAEPPADDDGLARFERQVQALRGAGEPMDAAQLKTWPTLRGDRNAAEIITAGGDRLRKSRKDGEGLFRLTKGPAKFNLPFSPEGRAEVRAELGRLREVIQSLDRLESSDGFDWGEAPTSPVVKWRGPRERAIYALAAAHLLRLDALSAIDAGDSSGAMRRVGQMGRIADGVALLPDNSGFLASCSIDALAAGVLQQLSAADGATHLSADQRAQVVTTIKGLLDDTPLRDRLRRRIAAERLVAIDTIRAVADGRLAARDLEGTGHVVRLFSGSIGYLRTHHDVVVEDFNREIGVIDSVESLSRAGVRGLREQALRPLAGQGIAAHRIASTFIGPDIASAWARVFETAGERRLAAVALGIRLYRTDHDGAWPSTLNALVPRYLPDEPDDPTSDAPAKVRYRLDGERATLWLSGENGRDDGAFEARPEMDGRERYEKTDRVVHLGPAVPP